MTDRARGLAVVTAAAAMFLVALILLALQVRAGRDPALGAAAQPRQVVVRRIIVRRVVEVDDRSAAAPRPTTSAPAAPVPAPAPAAPVTSRGS
jgi:hypothetical protein